MNLEPIAFAQNRGFGEKKKNQGLSNNCKCWALAVKRIEMVLTEMGRLNRIESMLVQETKVQFQMC